MVGICAPGRTRTYSVACLPLRMCWSETGCVSAGLPPGGGGPATAICTLLSETVPRSSEATSQPGQKLAAVKVTTTYAASECGGQRARTRLPSFPLDQHGLPLLLRRV